MKKRLIYAIATALLLTSSIAFAEETNQEKTNDKKQVCKCLKSNKKQMEQRKKFEERLKLTEEQKKQAHEIRMNGHKKMKPIADEMKALRTKANEIKANEKLSEEEKNKKLAPIKKEMKNLHLEARKIIDENTKELESILTEEQKQEFLKIKQEAREKFKKKHPRKKRNATKGKINSN